MQQLDQKHVGDTVAVHPDDERYKKYIGKKILLPIVNKEIPLADSYVDKELDRL